MTVTNNHLTKSIYRDGRIKTSASKISLFYKMVILYNRFHKSIFEVGYVARSASVNNGPSGSSSWSNTCWLYIYWTVGFYYCHSRAIPPNSESRSPHLALPIPHYAPSSPHSTRHLPHLPLPLPLPPFRPPLTAPPASSSLAQGGLARARPVGCGRATRLRGARRSRPGDTVARGQMVMAGEAARGRAIARLGGTRGSQLPIFLSLSSHSSMFPLSLQI